MSENEFFHEIKRDRITSLHGIHVRHPMAVIFLAAHLYIGVVMYDVICCQHVILNDNMSPQFIVIKSPNNYVCQQN